jgi:hypothetical protein
MKRWGKSSLSKASAALPPIPMDAWPSKRSPAPHDSPNLYGHLPVCRDSTTGPSPPYPVSSSSASERRPSSSLDDRRADSHGSIFDRLPHLTSDRNTRSSKSGWRSKLRDFRQKASTVKSGWLRRLRSKAPDSTLATSPTDLGSWLDQPQLSNASPVAPLR